MDPFCLDLRKDTFGLVMLANILLGPFLVLALHVTALQRLAFLQVLDFELLGLLDQCEVVCALLGLPGLELRFGGSVEY